MKFGGTSVADAGSVSRVVEIIHQYYSAGNEVAIETLEIANEGLTIEND